MTLHAPPACRSPAKPQKIRARDAARSVVLRTLNPRHLFNALKLQLNRKAHRHSYNDAQLALYSQILPSDFLHYGFFEDPAIQPEDIRLSDLVRAQLRYSELLLDLAGSSAEPVLDVGCGMGGLSRMLQGRGFSPVALTPDKLQAAHIKATLPDVPVVRCKFEQLPWTEYTHRFGTIITAESLQYLKLEQALPILQRILRPDGRWVACDYFHSATISDKACHNWDEFSQTVRAAGWKLTFERNITSHVLPTLAYLHMWAVRFGMPLMEFAFLRLRRKQPGLHHLISDALEVCRGIVQQNIQVIDPEKFARDRRYMLLVMERG